MKFKIFLILSLCLSSILSSKNQSKQLFDTLTKQTTQKKQSGAPSLFGSIAKNAPKPAAKKNLFDNFNVNFNQIKEKALEGAGASKNQAAANTVGTKKADSLFANLKSESKVNTGAAENSANKALIKVGSENTSVSASKSASVSASKSTSTTASTSTNTKSKPKKNKKDQKVISKLKKNVKMLMQMNEKLMKKFKSLNMDKKKKKKLSKKVVSFIQQYDSDVSKLKKNIQSSKNQVENKINKKDEEFKNLYKSTEKNFVNLQSQVSNVHSQLNDLVTEEEKKLKELKSNFQVKDLEVKGKVDVDGIAFINKLNAHSIDLGKIKFDSNGISFNDENVKLIIGKDVMTIGQLSANLKSFKKLISLCGKNFEKCRPVSDDVFREQADKQQAILDHLKKLRTETTKVLTRNKKFR